MKNSEIAIWVGALAGVALVILFLMQENGGESGGKVEPVFQVSGITPEVAAIYSGERLAKISAQKDIVLGVLAQKLGMTQANNALTLGINQSNTALQLGTIVSNNEVKMNETTTSGAVQVSQQQSMSAVQVAQLQADAQKYTAKKEASGKTISAVGGTIGSILGGIAKFF